MMPRAKRKSSAKAEPPRHFWRAKLTVYEKRNPLITVMFYLQIVENMGQIGFEMSGSAMSNSK